jgi:ubiquinone biosynthesis protein
LHPHINIWQVARPTVEGYIRENVGPRAVVRDLARTARVLARFGPKLPRLVEAQLIRQAEPPAPAAAPRQVSPVLWMLTGAVIAAAGIWLGTTL